MSERLVSRLLEGTGIDYQYNQAWLDEKGKGERALAATRFAGQELPDGSIATHDTIILGDNATYGAYLEELFHIWQGNNLYHGDAAPSVATAAMECMNTVLNFIFDQIYGNGTWGDAPEELFIPSEILQEVMKHFTTDENGISYTGYEIDDFVSAWNEDLFQSWIDTYKNSAYGKGTDDDWDWNWKDAYNWWLNNYCK